MSYTPIDCLIINSPIEKPSRNCVRAIGKLSIPPENRLERPRGDREYQYGIRINQQFRICFRWEGGHAYEVEIVDYH